MGYKKVYGPPYTFLYGQVHRNVQKRSMGGGRMGHCRDHSKGHSGNRQSVFQQIMQNWQNREETGKKVDRVFVIIAMNLFRRISDMPLYRAVEGFQKDMRLQETGMDGSEALVHDVEQKEVSEHAGTAPHSPGSVPVSVHRRWHSFSSGSIPE